MAFRWGRLAPVAAMLANAGKIDASLADCAKTASCASTEASAGDETDHTALLHFARAVRRNVAAAEVAAEFITTSRFRLGGKWKLGGELTPGGRVAKLKMLKSRVRRMKKESKMAVAHAAASQSQKKNLLAAGPKMVVGGKWKLQAKAHAGFDFSAFASQRAKQEEDCMDTDTGGAADRDGDVCWQYAVYPQWCGGYDDDDFVSGTMCCACGGGQAAAAPANVPLPEPQPAAPSNPEGPPAAPPVPEMPVAPPQPPSVPSSPEGPPAAPPVPQMPDASPQAPAAPSSPEGPPAAPAQPYVVQQTVWWPASGDSQPPVAPAAPSSPEEPQPPQPPATPSSPEEPTAPPPQTPVVPPQAGCVDTDNGAGDRDGDACWGYSTHPQWCGGYDDEDFSSLTMCCVCGGGSEPGSEQPPSPPLPPQQVGAPRQTTSGCECQSEWSLAGSSSVCADGCCNPDNDAGGNWCAVVDETCQGANWGYCVESSPHECVDTDAGASDQDGDVCWQYSVFPQWCSGYDDEDFTSSVMCCACGGGGSGEQQTQPADPTEEPSSPITEAVGVCADTDGSASDRDGDYCWGYTDHPQWCGGYDDDDFTSTSMCCACGGGSGSADLEASSGLAKKSSCSNTDAGTTGDVDGDHCSDYSANPEWCTNGDFSDVDFNEFTMCCACGGGSTPSVIVSSTCDDTDGDSTGDQDGDHCAEYAHNQQWCLGDFGDADFDAYTMCCVCGGGTTGSASPHSADSGAQAAAGPFSHAQSTCADGDADSTGDQDGDKCSAYTAHPDWCEGNFGDEDFNAPSMCCVCGGGSAWANHIF